MNISTEKAMELRKAQKKFWANWKKVQAYTDAQNKNAGECYSWGYYYGFDSVANFGIFPEITNYNIAKFIIEGEEMEDAQMFILNLK